MIAFDGRNSPKFIVDPLWRRLANLGWIPLLRTASRWSPPMFRLALAALFLAGVALPAGAAPAPKVGIASFTQLKTPLPYPYDEKADADPRAVNARVAAAKARAKASGKLLLIDLGGNWCGDCRILAATMELPKLKAFVDRHYELVEIDVGRMDKNLQVPAAYGITKRLEGVPSLLVVDPRTDRLLNAGRTANLSDARHMTPQSLADYLAHWTR
jgi:thiol-disulfide isomerase/thioredoxin